MEAREWFSPYEAKRRVGSVIVVGATEAQVNLSSAGSGEPNWFFGNRIGAGEVNEFVFIDVGSTCVFGRIVNVWINGGERLSVDSLSEPPSENHPIGIVQLLVSVNAATGKNYRGVLQYPRLGAQVYSAHPHLVAQLAEGKEEEGKLHLSLATLPNDSSVVIHASPERLFSRHCGILGSTGGGKSYTVANLLEQVVKLGGKALLIDPTGEFSKLPAKTWYVGEKENVKDEQKACFPHWQFTDTDIRTLLRPSPQSQTPKLEEAIRSLRIIKYYGDKLPNGITSKHGYLVKEGQQKAPFLNAVKELEDKLDILPWSFKHLATQIDYECIWPNAGNNNNPIREQWGVNAQNDVGHCLNLISRIKSYSNSKDLKWMLDPSDSLRNIPDLLEEFLDNEESGLLRLDVSAVPFEANAREILVNAIGRKLLSLARDKKISFEKPLLVFIDESHQFLNKKIGDENNRFELDAFGNIAKEGRKYGLNVVIATQRPRDIPEDVLSQIGTLIVHRLTNQYDQEMVKKGVGEIDQRSASFLPTLGQGEALLLGVDFPFPMTVKMRRPEHEPHSRSALYSSAWKPKDNE